MVHQDEAYMGIYTELACQWLKNVIYLITEAGKSGKFFNLGTIYIS